MSDLKEAQAANDSQATQAQATEQAGPMQSPLNQAVLQRKIQQRAIQRQVANNGGQQAPAGNAPAGQAQQHGAQPQAAAAAHTAAELSGAQWVARFPGSSSLTDLSSGFRPHATAFVNALRAAGATVNISATLRPPERAYLMHWSWAIAHGTDPAHVPAHAGVNINWAHPTAAASRAAAQAMVNGYGIVYQPALASRHTEGRALDMDISWGGTLNIHNAAGHPVAIATTPRSGANAELHAVGQSYGVIKLLSDPPHWSDDGH